MRRATEVAYIALALGLSGALLWPRVGLPAVLILVAAAAAVIGAVSSRTNSGRASAVMLLAVAATLFARDVIAMPGTVPRVDPRSVWLVVLLAIVAVAVAPERWFTIRPASAATAAVAASFLTPFTDTRFYRVEPPIFLQIAVLALALVLIAVMPLERWPRHTQLVYTIVEPVLICLGAWAIAAPFVRHPAVLLGLGTAHFGAVFAVPASIAAGVVSTAIHLTHRDR